MNVVVSPLSSKFQVTVPAEVREALEIESTDYELVWMKSVNGGIIINARKKLAKDENPFMSVFGMLKNDGKILMSDSLIADRRADAKRDRL